MAHMQSYPAGIRKHIQYIKFWPGTLIADLVCPGSLPLFLPFFFYLPEIVFHAGYAMLVYAFNSLLFFGSRQRKLTVL
jgi:hypothetical protein